MDQAEAALGGDDQLAALLVGRSRIDSGVAKRLTNLVGGSQDFWLERERQYRGQIRRAEGYSAEVDAELQWLSELPVADMRTFGWIDREQSRRKTVESCLRFFDVGSVPEWRERYAKPLGIAAFRASVTFKQSPGAVAVWLHAANAARPIPGKAWSKSELETRLPEIRALTRKKDPAKFLPELVVIMGECGVAISVTPAPSGCRASGASYFIDDTPVIALSFRHKTDDHFWFTLFHEIGHLLLHDSKMIYIDDDSGFDSDEESEANIFAREALIPNHWCNEIRETRGMKDVLRLARSIGVSPGILVGYMQHERIISYQYMNRLKTRYRWKAGSPQPSL